MNKWIPRKASRERVVRARKAKALRALRRGQQRILEEASLRADFGIERLKAELGAVPPAQGVHSVSGKRQ